MKKSILLIALTLALTSMLWVTELAAQHQKKPSKSHKAVTDTAKADTTKLSDTFTQPADTMYKPGSDMAPDKKFRGRAPGAPGIEPDAGDPPADPKADPAAKSDTVKSSYLSPDKGIGPVKELKVGPIDTALVSKGKVLFNGQCITCHQLDKKKIGPPLRTVTNDRPPEFIMNMILNADEMEKKNPEVKKLISQYGVLMSVSDIKQDQARQILEYLRWEAKQPSTGK